MTALSLVISGLADEQRSFWRNPAAAFSTFLFPLAMLLIFASLFSTTTIPVLGEDMSYPSYYVPSILAFAVMGTCFFNLAFSVSVRRDAGVLKRIRATPAGRGVFLAGLVSNSVVIGILLSGTVCLVGALLFDVSVPRNLVPLIVVLAVGSGSFCAIGLAIVGALPDGNAAQATLNAIFYPLAFLSGTFYPLPDGSTIEWIASIFPLAHYIDAVFAAFGGPGRPVELAAGDLAFVAGWGAVSAVIASRTFSWLPRHRV